MDPNQPQQQGNVQNEDYIDKGMPLPVLFVFLHILIEYFQASTLPKRNSAKEKSTPPRCAAQMRRSPMVLVACLRR
jgi:hypothetical protein